MEQEEQLLLEPLLNELPSRRRFLLPTWIKVFVWIFMIMGSIVPFGILAGIFGGNFQIALYGLTSYSPLSPLGLFLSFLFLLKGITAFSLWTEQNWAIDLAIVDAIIGIVVCVIVMVVLPFQNIRSGFSFNFRLELVLLIPYLIKLQRIRVPRKHV